MPNKISLEQFIEKANRIHNNKYDYSRFNYQGSNFKSIIICPTHGQFLQIAGNHIRGNGCLKCKNAALGKKLKFSKEKFIKKSIQVHGNKYDYSNFVYEGSNVKGVIICPEHGEFLQIAGNHIRGNGCPKCSYGSLNKFIKKSMEKHGDKYNYSNFIYKNSITKGIIICFEHGEFLQTSSDHQQGHGCPKCKAKKTKEMRFLGVEKFVERANKIHNNKYDYSMFKYIRNDTKGIIMCSKHGEFLQTPHNHLIGYGCSKCYFDTMKLTKDEFIEKANKIHNNKYDYSKFEYISSDLNGIIICSDHGEFLQSAHSHLSGCGCFKCSIIYSKKCDKWIDSFNNKNIIKHYKFKINNRRFEFDGFDETSNTIYEFYGDMFHGNPRVFPSGSKIYYGKFYGDLYKKTMEREEFLKKCGFNLITVWEDEFDKKEK